MFLNKRKPFKSTHTKLSSTSQRSPGDSQSCWSVTSVPAVRSDTCQEHCGDGRCRRILHHEPSPLFECPSPQQSPAAPGAAWHIRHMSKAVSNLVAWHKHAQVTMRSSQSNYGKMRCGQPNNGDYLFEILSALSTAVVALSFSVLACHPL